MNDACIINGRIIDPANNIDGVGNLSITDGKITNISKEVTSHRRGEVSSSARVGKTISSGNFFYDATGQIVAPGLIDMHVHLREPGFEHKETIATGTAAAAAGGFTTVACMANTSPVIDTPEKIEQIYDIADKTAKTNVFPFGSITKGLAGEELTDMREMRSAGAVGFSDDGVTVMNAALMRDALALSAELGFPVMVHCEEHNLNAGAVMNLGETSRKLGFIGSPNAAEDIIVARDIMLAEMTGGHLHVLHVSTAGAVELIRQGKKRGVHVTAEACPHHWILTDTEVEKQGTNAKMHPPLRTQTDIDAVLEGLCDGTIDAIATDHAPHALSEKAQGMVDAPNGIIGLETCLPLVLTYLVQPGHLTLAEVIKKMTVIPANILGIDRGTLSVGAVGDVTVIDIDLVHRVDVTKSRSKSRNTPFIGWELKGWQTITLRKGVTSYQLPVTS
ncbi:dihydroorotase [Candidatus Poribacteria bacterium]|nr:MAG: dihydroorotase [Candidatus Poribacteria bacterium]